MAPLKKNLLEKNLLSAKKNLLKKNLLEKNLLSTKKNLLKKNLLEKTLLSAKKNLLEKNLLSVCQEEPAVRLPRRTMSNLKDH